MKKILITLLILIVLAVLGWYFFLRGSTAPIAQTINNVLPFGTPGQGSVPPAGNGSPASFGTTTPNGTSAPTSRLFKISDAPVAGAVALVKSGQLVVRYVDSATGHIYDVNPQTLQKIEIVNTTVAKVYMADFTPDGTRVAYRTLPDDGDLVQTIIYTLLPPSGTSTADLYATKASSLPAGISALSVGSTSLAYVQKNSPGVTIANLDGTKPATAFSSAFNEWQLAVGGSSVLLTTNASVSVPGYAYITGASALNKVLGPNAGLTTKANDALSRVLYSASDADHSLFAKTVATGAVSSVGARTLAEKCTWAPRTKNAVYCGVPAEGVGEGEPDLWYQGQAHFNDRIWRYNVDASFSDLLVDPGKDFNISIDAENLFLAPDESYLFFMNRNDLSLWALKL